MVGIPTCGQEENNLPALQSGKRENLPSFSSIWVLTGWGEVHSGGRDLHFAQWYQGPLPSFMLHSSAPFISAELLYL